MPALPFIQAFGTIASVIQQNKAADAAERQYRAEQKRAEIQNIRAVRQQIREARLAQSSMVNQAAQSGGMGSSALAGGTASVGSQLAGNINYMQQIAQQNTAIGAAALEGAQAQSSASIFGTIGSAAGGLARETGAWTELLNKK